MGVNGRPPLASSLAIAQRGIFAPPDGSYGGDGLRIPLPPLPAGGGTLPSAASLRATAALYLQAELEQAGVIPLAEQLADSRGSIDFLSVEAAEKLEAFAERQRDWYDRRRREMLFARVFGLGGVTAAEARTASNRGFQQLFAAMCLALVSASERGQWGEVVSTRGEAALRVAAMDLLANLGPYQYGNTQPAARLIHEQLQKAIEILDHPGVSAAFQARGMWDTLRKAFGQEAPDFGRLVTRGQSGMRLLNWLADVLLQLNGIRRRALTGPDAPVVRWAASWLQASGVPVGTAVGN
jgi:hypothetical protein